MAKYGITHTCGHSETHQIVGTNSHGERDRQQARLAAQLCQDCLRRQRHEQAQAATAELPPLAGSAKQVTWATDLRAQKIRELESFIAGVLQRGQASVAAGKLAQDAYDSQATAIHETLTQIKPKTPPGGGLISGLQQHKSF